MLRLPFRVTLALLSLCLADLPAIAAEGTAGAQPRGEAAGGVPAGWEVLRDVPFGTGGGEKLTLFIARPKQKPARPLPLLVFIHGGGWSGGSAGTKGLDWCRHGYVTANIGYRLSGVAPFPAQIEDCKAAIRYLRAHAAEYSIDPNRIGVWGSSAGGHLALMIGTTGDVKEFEGKGGWAGHSTRVQAVGNLFGPADLRPGTPKPVSPSHVTKLLGGPPAQKSELAAKASPVSHATPDDPPVLSVYGENDPTVPYPQAERLDAALKAAGVDHTLIRLKDAGHVFKPRRIDSNGRVTTDGTISPSREEVDRRLLAFFDQHVKNARPAAGKR